MLPRDASGTASAHAIAFKQVRGCRGRPGRLAGRCSGEARSGALGEPPWRVGVSAVRQNWRSAVSAVLVKANGA